MKQNFVFRVFACLFGACLLAVAVPAVAVPEDCHGASADGMAICTDPQIVPSSPGAQVDGAMWTYSDCDDMAAYLSREYAWCIVTGGTWVTTPSGPFCSGGAIFDPDVVPDAIAFERRIHNACQIQNTDTGWGATVSSYNCWSGATVARNGILLRSYREMDFNGLSPDSHGNCSSSWSERVIAIKMRNLACPKGYNSRAKANGDLECWYLPPACCQVGNPVNPLAGNKLQEEVDFRSRAAGGLELTRYYNSQGFFQLGGSPGSVTDFWRTNWDSRIVASPSPAVLAYAQRADGGIKIFRPDGAELHNRDGGGSDVLAKLLAADGSLTGWQLTTGAKDIETYDAAGRLTSLVRRTGFTYRLSYDDRGQLATVDDMFGRTLALGRDSTGRLAAAVAPGDRTFQYRYDSVGRLASVIYPDGAMRTYVYEDPTFPHGLTGIIDENRQRFATWAYDSSGRAISSQHAGGAEAVTLRYSVSNSTSGNSVVTDAFGTARTRTYLAVGGVLRVTQETQPCPGCTNVPKQYTYDANGNVASLVDFNGNRTSFVFDLTRNLEASRVEASGTPQARTITTQWHPTYRFPIRITRPSGLAGVNEVTDFAYDAQGNLTQKTISAGTLRRQWSFAYNVLGQVLTATGPRTDVAETTSYVYYAKDDSCVHCRGNRKVVTNALGHATTYSGYDELGQPTEISDPNGVITRLAYDVRGRLTMRTDNAGDVLNAETTSFAYDSAGLLVKVTQPDGSFLYYQYDAAHRMTEVSDSLGNVIQYSLDLLGNRIQENVFDPQDRLVKTQRRIYDALSRLYQEIGASNQTYSYTYDSVGNRKVTTNPLNRITAQTYDALNRLLTTTDAANGLTTYTYDAADRLAAVKDARGLTTGYAFDGMGNLVQLTSPDTGVASYAYDAAGNVTAMNDARSLPSTFILDALNRQTFHAFSGGSVAYGYDNQSGGAYATGRLTSVTDPSGLTSFVYDAIGRVLMKTQTVWTGSTAKNFTVGYRYGRKRLLGTTYPSGRDIGYHYDAQGRVTEIFIDGQLLLGGVTYLPFGGVASWIWANGEHYGVSYDLDGRVSSLTLGPATSTYPSDTWNIAYDPLDRLTADVAPDGRTYAFAYDVVGNRTQASSSDRSATSYAYAATSNRLLSTIGGTSRNYVYDNAGNVTTSGSIAMAYDGRGRLVAAGSTTYQVNGLGQRVAKTGPSTPTGVNYFAYDEMGRLLGEYDAASTPIQETVWLSNMPVATLRAGTAGPSTQTYYVYPDHLGTPRFVTRPADNAIVWQWDNAEPFGATSANPDPSGLGNFNYNLRFPGQYYDAETGTHYNYFRDYDPSIGRYEESDPIGLTGGTNTYVYVLDPLTQIDPKGEMGRAPSPGKPAPGPIQRPGHPNAGCGPNGKLLELFIPDNPIYAFGSCCDDHDDCYSDCKNKPSKEACDQKFCGCLRKKCRIGRGGVIQGDCLWLASVYCNGVKGSNGQDAFDESRKECKGC